MEFPRCVCVLMCIYIYMRKYDIIYNIYIYIYMYMYDGGVYFMTLCCVYYICMYVVGNTST
jgi:hypothetical protein